MHTPLLRLRVNARMTLAFATLILITIAVAASGLWSLRETDANLDVIVDQHMVKMQLANDMLGANAQVMNAIQGLLLEQDPAKRQPYLDRIAKSRADYDVPRDKLFELPASEASKEVRARITPRRDEARRLNQIVVDLVNAGDIPGAIRSYEAGEAATTQWQTVIRDNITMQQTEAAAAAVAAERASERGTRMLVTGAVLAVVLSALLAFMITRSLVLPLRQATEAADRIARGVVDQPISVQGQDETAALLRSMATMQHRVSDLIVAQRELTTRQMAGISSYRIPATDVPGAFGELVDASNQLAQHNQDVIAAIVSTAASYSVGQLDVRMQALPGEQAAVTAAMERTRDNLSAVSTEISRLASAAAQGDFSHRGDVDAFQNTYRDIITHLNAMFDACDGSLSEIARLLDASAHGDLTQEATGAFGGVFGSIRDAANLSADNLRRIIAGIQTSTQIISTSASEIATGNSDLSQRTEQQAANLEETAASMEELTSTVRQNADHSRRAAEMAHEAEDQATQGGSAVREIVATMENIATSSARVSDIVSMIDAISFQTNILALNAAVEAARAGEQGRGFAVVASEVRVLAQRSAAAAKDVKTLIDGATEEVSRGVELVGGAGRRMTQIVGSIQQVRQAMAEISAASQEQTAGIEQVSQTVTHMDEATQQNAALVEEASAAARSLEEQVNALDEAVAVFKV